MLVLIGLFIFSYFLGSIPTGYLLARSKGIDIRDVGSGNIGATNVARALGKKAAIATFAGDALKGVIPVLVAGWLDLGIKTEAVAGLLAFLGHCFSVFLKFKGGKGVATGFGACLALAPVPALIAIALWGVIFLSTRLSSLAALVAALVLPWLVWFISKPPVLFYYTLPVIVILIFNHRENIQRLWKGKESKF
ncbi:MAG: glycerol-3-phosphate 1-O-acyltransferase PlsY [bacterium]|nr:glycerol-3-phosphate 1-O-acyltransferase PlsY [bacterium]